MLRQALLGLLIIVSSSAFGDVQTIQVEPQRTFSITLESNRMTGYHWELAKPVDPRYLVFLKKKYTKPEYKLSRQMGHEKWDFRSLAAGETVISMKYLQPWDQDSPSLKTQMIRVKIAKKTGGKTPDNFATDDEIALLIKERAQVVVQALMVGEYLTLSQYVHPKKGVRFSPYAGKISGRDLVFSAEEITRFLSDQRRYYWGKYDGTELPIKLTAAEYFKSFVNDRNFAKAQPVKYFYITGLPRGYGKFYKGKIAAEFYLPGTNPKYSGMDWKSLRLIFEKVDEQYFLVGVLHDGWTI